MNDLSVKIMIVDDDTQSLRSMSTLLRTYGFDTPISVSDPTSVHIEIEKHNPYIILLDLHMPGLSGQELLEMINEKFPETIVIIVTADNQIQMAVTCTQLGAHDYFVKPIDQDRFAHVLKKAIENKKLNKELILIQKHLLSHSTPTHPAFASILTNSDKMKQLFKYIEAIANSSRPILILGETGTGKELFAKAIHDVSDRQGKFVAVNIAALDEVTLSDSLFGHKKGAFTDAKEHRKGLIHRAKSGSLFLDEIGDLSASSQIKLLRLIQENNYYPLGSDNLEHSSARIITATHQNLDELIAEGVFRRDLYFRLQMHTIIIPPLRERLEDLPILVKHFLTKACEELNRPLLKVSSKIIDLLAKCSFEGNLRELEAIIFDTVVHSQGQGRKLDKKYLLQAIENISLQQDQLPSNEGNNYFSGVKNLPTIKSITEELINEALNRSQNNQKKASEILGISRQALNKRLVRRGK